MTQNDRQFFCTCNSKCKRFWDIFCKCTVFAAQNIVQVNKIVQRCKPKKRTTTSTKQRKKNATESTNS